MLCVVIDGNRTKIDGDYILIATRFRSVQEARYFDLSSSDTALQREREVANILAGIDRRSYLCAIDPFSRFVTLHEALASRIACIERQGQRWHVIKTRKLNVSSGLSENYRLPSLTFTEQNIQEIFTDDTIHQYIRTAKHKPSNAPKRKTENKKPPIKGTIHGHGKMRRENQEASVHRTNEYVEGMRNKGK